MTELDAPPTLAGDGPHAFDFFAGTWKAENRKRVKPLDPDDTEWVAFEGEIVSKPILHGMGTTDTFRIPDMPGRGDFEGFTLRLLDPDTGLWRIWWASTVNKGQLDTPVVGRFHDERYGTFECDDVIDDLPVRVRYTWKIESAVSVHWEQAFSFDEGVSWDTNWITDAERISLHPAP